MGTYGFLPQNLASIRVKVTPEEAGLIQEHQKVLSFVSQQIGLLMTGTPEEKESTGKFLEDYYSDCSCEGCGK